MAVSDRINVQLFHKPLADARIVPDNCRLIEMSIGVSGGFILRYEVFLTVSQLITLGGIFQDVGLQLVKEG